MPTSKQDKLDNLKKLNSPMYDLVVSGKMTITEAYNEAKRIQLGLSEYRGPNTKKNQFATDFKRIIALHNPSQEELISEIQKAFPLTWKQFIKLD